MRAELTPIVTIDPAAPVAVREAQFDQLEAANAESFTVQLNVSYAQLISLEEWALCYGPTRIDVVGATGGTS